MRAIETFDPDRGYAFATYAVPWIKQRMRRHYEDTHTTVRFPVYLQQLNRHYNKLKGEHPEEDDKFFIRLIAKQKKVQPATVLWAIKMNSIKKFSHIDDEENNDVLVAQSTVGMDEAYSVDFQALMKVLTYREKFIIMERSNGMTLSEIALVMEISRERVRQIEKVALHKLRASVNLKDKAYLFNQ